MAKTRNRGESAKDRQIARLILGSEEFSKKYEEFKEFVERVESSVEKEFQIPVSVFKTNKLGVLEIAVKYLVEESGLSIEHISKSLNRSYTTIHSTYQKSKKKRSQKFSAGKGFLVDARVFSDRKVSPLFSIVAFLKDEKGMRFVDIARALDRDVRNVSFTYHKYKKNG